MAHRRIVTEEDQKITLEWLEGKRKMKELSTYWGQRSSSPSPYIHITRVLKEAKKRGALTINHKAYD